MTSHAGTPVSASSSSASSSPSSSSLVAALSFAAASAALAGVRAARRGHAAAAAAATAAASNAQKEDPFRPLTTFVESMVNDGVIPFITLKVERAGRELYSHSYGAFTTPEVENAPFESSTLARFYSMTKPVTSAAILLLWERLQGGDSLFDLDAPISKYMPEWDDERVRVVVTPDDGPDPATISDPQEFVTEPARRPITARHLLTHTSGLSYGFWPDVVSKTSRAMANAGLELPCPISDDSRRLDKSGLNYPTSLEDFCRRLQDIPLVAHPGEEFHYSCATDVLGRLVECLDPQHRTLPEFFQDEFFTPLGMVDTAFTVSDDKLSRFAPCFAVDDSAAEMNEDGRVYMVSPAGKRCRFRLASFYGVGEVSRATPFHAESTSNFKVLQAPSGGGGLVSTVDDYIKFARMLHDGTTADGTRILKAETLAMMREDHLKPRGATKKNLALYFDGFGLGVSCVVRRDQATGEPVESLENPGGKYASEGTGGWSGAAQTNFFIDPDPSHHVTLVFATQMLYLGARADNPIYALRQTIANLAMEAIFGGCEEAAPAQHRSIAATNAEDGEKKVDI